MQIIPKEAFEKIELPSILSLIAKGCAGEPAHQEILAILPESNHELIGSKLLPLRELLNAYSEGAKLDLLPYINIDPTLKHVRIERALISGQEVLAIYRYIRNAQIIATLVKKFPSLLSSWNERISILPQLSNLAKSIDKIYDDEGHVKSDASPEIVRLRRLQLSKKRELDRTFRGIVQNLRQQGKLTDTEETLRNGRRVLSVPAEHKRSINGIIHDESSSGQTAYIEPAQAIAINNDIFDLEQEEKREVARLIAAICDQIRQDLPSIRDWMSIVVWADIIQAKAEFCLRINGSIPTLSQSPKIILKDAVHPLLWLKHQKSKLPTIPLDVELDKPGMLLISGPNAGGKSVALKTIGLLQVMAQCALPVTAHNESTFGIFETFCVEIGDSQSLEDDLSTYSARLVLARKFLEAADEKTLVLIDEFGSGTDPKIGGTIAEGVLNNLLHQNTKGVVTTHYANLKYFAEKRDDIMNGAMEFDQEKISPTYRLQVGKPGSSYAFEIASTVGLQKSVISYARKQLSSSEYNVEKLLGKLQKEKQELESQLSEAKKRETTLNHLIANYEKMQHDLEVRRKKLKMTQRERDLLKETDYRKELDKLVRELRETKNLEKAQKLAQKAKKQKEQIAKEVTKLDDQLYQALPEKDRNLKVGDFVRLRSNPDGDIGKIISMSKGKAQVQLGILTLDAKVKDLISAKEPIKTKKASVKLNRASRSTSFNPNLDLRGMKKEESVAILEKFLDEALLANASMLNILHGKGNGVLRKAVHQKLREYKAVSEISHPSDNQGGIGVTLVSLIS